VKSISAIFAQVLKAFQNSRFYQKWILSDSMKPDLAASELTSPGRCWNLSIT
jgi:hypothetical protein